MLYPYEPGPYNLEVASNNPELNTTMELKDQNLDVHYVIQQKTAVDQNYKQTNQIFNIAVLLTLLITGLNLVYNLNERKSSKKELYQSLSLHWIKIFWVPISIALILATIVATLV